MKVAPLTYSQVEEIQVLFFVSCINRLGAHEVIQLTIQHTLAPCSIALSFGRLRTVTTFSCDTHTALFGQEGNSGLTIGVDGMSGQKNLKGPPPLRPNKETRTKRHLDQKAHVSAPRIEQVGWTPHDERIPNVHGNVHAQGVEGQKRQLTGPYHAAGTGRVPSSAGGQ